MLPATLPSPSDIKPVLWAFKSIFGTCTAQQAGQHTGQQGSTCDSSGHTGQQATSWDHQQPPQAGQLTACTTGHQQATACQHWAELGRSADQAKNPAKTGQKQARSKEKNFLLMTFCISQKTRFLELFQYMLELFHYCTYPVLYEKPVQNDKNGYFLACKRVPPPCQFF